MKRLVPILLALALLLVSSPAALAWTEAQGCTVDANGDPWAWGGTVTCRQTFEPYVVTGSGTLDANGCFSIYIGNGRELDCTIDYTPGPSGDPADGHCIVPTDGSYTPQPWLCGPIDTGTGPNAVSLSGFGAQSLPASAAVLVLGLLAGGAAVLRRRQA